MHRCACTEAWINHGRVTLYSRIGFQFKGPNRRHEPDTYPASYPLEASVTVYIGGHIQAKMLEVPRLDRELSHTSAILCSLLGVRTELVPWS